jgi:hypothetical protein
MDGLNQDNNIPQEIPVPDVGTKGQPAPRQGKGWRWLAAAVCVIAALGAASAAAWTYYTSRPLYLLAKGFQNLRTEMDAMKNPLAEKTGMGDILTRMEEEGSHVESRLDVKSDRFPNSITLGVDTDWNRDVQAKELGSVTDISVMNNNLATLEVYGTEDVICFSVPELFLENMYFNTENVVSQYNGSVFSESLLFGKAEIEDFSIDLFPDYGVGLSPGQLLNGSELWERYEDDIQTCGENMTIEKVSKTVCRVVLRQQDVESLLCAVMSDSAFFYEKAGIHVDDIRAEYDQVISADVSLLFTLDPENRFESIELEQPVPMLDGETSLSGGLFFLGEQRTIEKLQCKMALTTTDSGKTEILGLVEQSREENDYQVDMKLQYGEGDSETAMNLSFGCDDETDDFHMMLSGNNGQDSVEIAAEGSLDDFSQGESVALDLDKVTCDRNGERLVQIRGQIAAEPLTEEVNSDVKAQTPVFDMTYGDLVGIAYQNLKEYGSILKRYGW